ncbi:MAG: hypothetical protein A2908_02195 [Candidatus Staskawiczbacteria bacterium RIFCSPLOWO2_01_FULL_38_12b]|uniref:EamA domain-containing protein n=1 Tax=Candidatus Staskawiczbacteria bacterium RIFCSPLOWO2_01_FULL_38_12b TaxID=1802214 RepID=A0A1G2IFF0_9BACT|nr:MAG: hypothetical protein A2908_02195 [Candidatus Staskawiczbacteria bacterium RIFCSPLOWO2_01_FULL_38_12b]
MFVKFIYIILIILAATAVAVGDVLLKKASGYTNFSHFLKSPWIIFAALLYLFSIIVFSYIFFSGVQLINVGIVQLILYALIIVGSGVLFFNEKLTIVKMIGVALGVTAVILMNL